MSTGTPSKSHFGVMAPSGRIIPGIVGHSQDSARRMLAENWFPAGWKLTSQEVETICAAAARNGWRVTELDAGSDLT